VIQNGLTGSRQPAPSPAVAPQTTGELAVDIARSKIGSQYASGVKVSPMSSMPLAGARRF
jgi:hypothetical protein